MKPVKESDLENAALQWFADLRYEVLQSDNLEPDGVHQERHTLEDVVLKGRLEAAMHRLNPEAPIEAIEEALRRIQRHDAPTLVQNNLAFHRMLSDGLPIEVPASSGGVRGVHLRLFDFEEPDNNDWVVVNQVSIVDKRTGTGQLRIPDLLVYVNGLPLAVFELKNPAAQDAGVEDAYNQLQTYQQEIPSLFVTNCILVVSDDVHALLGSLTAPESRFLPWRTVAGEGDEPRTAQPLKVLVDGVFEKSRFLDLVRNFITFEQDRATLAKKLAGYHQFHAVRRAVAETTRASSAGGDRRVGVVWHTQGSGKSLSMLFYARKLILEAAMENPTLVVLTDRNDLDGQLFGTFSKSQALLRQEPIQARDRSHLRELLRTAAGGVYFTTVQKFLPDDGERQPALSKRRNIVVIADEAHRSQYGFKARVDQKTGDVAYGFAVHMRDALPAASFIGFTGTPVELEDKNTVQVFGDYISVYDIRRSVEDKATVPIYYENRLAKLDLDEREKPKIDPTFEELMEGEEEDRKEALKSEWSTVEALVGTEKRLALVAQDMVQHFEKRLTAMEGKALIVCMSRRICVDLHDQLVKLRPQWYDEDDDAGALKVVMTGSAADVEKLRPHVRTKARREGLADRFKDPGDPLKLVIVRDMWLTGFDAPCMHTLYVDKPMRGHNLMQAIARVNRVFGDKPGGLVVDYIGIATFLRDAMVTYSQSGGTGDATHRQEQAVEVMLEKLEVCRDGFHGFDYQGFFTGSPKDRLALLPAAREHVLGQRSAPGSAKGARDGYDVFGQAVGELSSAFTLAMPHDQCEAVRDEVAFFQAVKVGLVKLSQGRAASSAALGHAVRQIVANAIVTEGVMDVFDAVGLAKPDISILSPEFLAEVQGMKNKNLAAALLQKLLGDEVRKRAGSNAAQARKFSELLERAIARYKNRTIGSVEVIEELLKIARQFRDADRKGEELSLSKDEAAFYDALADNESAERVMGDQQLAAIARELTQIVRNNATVDWNKKRSVQAQLRVSVKRLLKKHGYPPDAQTSATELVLEQAMALGINMTEGGSVASSRPRAPSAPPTSIRSKVLPYPIAVFDSLVESQENPVLRVKTRRDGFEKVLSFLVGIELALLRELNGGKLPEPAFAVLKEMLGRPVSMGIWVKLAWRLAALLPANSNDGAVVAARSLVTVDGKPSLLTKEIQDMVPDRNDFAHGVTATEESVVQAEAPLHDLWQRFKQALEGLTTSRLVVRADMVDFEADGKVRYKLRILQGGNDHFPVREETVQGKLAEEWCYLLRPGGALPLALSPVVACAYSEESQRREVFVARTLGVEPGSKIDAMGITSQTKRKLSVPAT
jgi:type I restriction enzyme R subunit